jgi:hypothetical protein
VQAFNLNDDESSIVHLDLLHQIVPSPVNLFEPENGVPFFTV